MATLHQHMFTQSRYMVTGTLITDHGTIRHTGTAITHPDTMGIMVEEAMFIEVMGPDGRGAAPTLPGKEGIEK